MIVFKKKRRKGFRVKNGHRQALTEIQIDNILASGAKKEAPAKVVAKPAAKVAPPKAVAKPAAKEADAPKVKEAPKDLSKMTVAQLKEMAKAKGITGISAMKKADLIAALS